MKTWTFVIFYFIITPSFGQNNHTMTDTVHQRPPEEIDLTGWTLDPNSTNPQVYTKDGVTKSITAYENYTLEEHFMNDLLHGLTVGRMHEAFIHPSGEKSRIYLVEAYLQGERHGISTNYYDDGSWTEREYQADLPHGVWQTWEANCQLTKQEHYHQGQKHGRQQTWFDNGQLEQEAHYQHGVQHGDYIKYFESGLLRRRCTYVDGHIEGLLHERWTSGEYSESEYVKGQAHGEQKTYHADGSIMRIGHRVQGQRQGEWLWYHPNGQWSIREVYVDDKLDGERYLYDENGELESTQVYEMGERVK